MASKYNLVENSGFRNLTVLLAGELQSITGDHPRFDSILETVRDPEFGNDPQDETNLLESLDPSKGIAERFEKVSEQIAIHNGNVLFEGRIVNDVLTDTIVRFYDEGNEDFKPLVLFLEKLNTNPNEHSKTHLYRWLKAQQLSISTNGDFIAYKGVRNDFTSQHAGDGIVDGEWYNHAHLPNKPGSVVEMPRDSVTFDPNNGCSFGLHAGSWNYASSFAPVTLEVHINPRDVVSVPTDCGDQKLRTCRYKVIQVLDNEYSTAYVWDGNDEDEIPETEDDIDYEDPEPATKIPWF